MGEPMAISVLLVEDNDADAHYLEHRLQQVETPFVIQRVSWLSSAKQVVEVASVDVILLDLSLPDVQGIDTVVELSKIAPSIPVVVMTGYDDLPTAVNAVRCGAQDYLIKDEVQAKHLERTLLLAIERKRVDEVGKGLIHASLNTLDERPGTTPTQTLLRDHVAKLVDALEAIQSYVRKNAHAHSDALDAIVSRYDLPVVLKEIRNILSLGTSSPGRKRISHTAMQAVSSVADKWANSRERVADLQSAKDAVLDVIQRRERSVDG